MGLRRSGAACRGLSHTLRHPLELAALLTLPLRRALTLLQLLLSPQKLVLSSALPASNLGQGFVTEQVRKRNNLPLRLRLGRPAGSCPCTPHVTLSTEAECGWGQLQAPCQASDPDRVWAASEGGLGVQRTSREVNERDRGSLMEPRAGSGCGWVSGPYFGVKAPRLALCVCPQPCSLLVACTAFFSFSCFVPHPLVFLS